MLRSRAVATLVSSCFILSTFVVGFTAAAQKPWQPIILERVAVGGSDILPGPGGRGVIGVPITSKSVEPVWVALQLRAPGPVPESSVRLTLAPQRDTVLVFPQDAFVADADYVISVAVFVSESQSDTLESGSSVSRLSKKDLKALNEWLRASTLPKTFKNVEKVDKVTAGTALSSMFGVPKGGGTLTVDSTGVTYITKKETLVIPASELRDVALNNADPRQPWVVITYEHDGEKKSVSFKPNVYGGDASAPQIAAAIQRAMSRLPTGN